MGQRRIVAAVVFPDERVVAEVECLPSFDSRVPELEYWKLCYVKEPAAGGTYDDAMGSEIELRVSGEAEALRVLQAELTIRFYKMTAQARAQARKPAG